ncbi:glycosyltransferase [Acinetobacter sp. YH12153]|uniref:glycosyltransferase n=2 Tax=unclassified Acinetobacter TaxID=196816 RepID=UPI0015D1517F|nr:glycosyltransferase [Acinetobacter sp. YH12153]
MSYQNMKLLLLIPSLGSGGAERQLVTLAVLFKRKGLDVEFLIYRKDFFYLNILEKNNIKVNILNPKNYFDRVIKVRRFIQGNNYDIIISFLEISAFLSCISSVGKKKWKLITTELSSKKSTFEGLRGKFFGWFRRYSDYIVCNSFNAMNMWEKYYPEYHDKYKVIYNPVILNEISTEYSFKKNGKINLVIAASYQYLKNPIGLINSVALMNDDLRNNIEIHWYGRKEVKTGDTKAYDEACELIKTLKLNNTIFLHEATHEIADKMNEADVVGLFSQLEGLPNAICEAMLIGKPIIMTRVSDYHALVSDNGFLCDWDDIDSIRKALEEVASLTKVQQLFLGENSKVKAEKLFSTESIVDQWFDLL